MPSPRCRSCRGERRVECPAARDELPARGPLQRRAPSNRRFGNPTLERIFLSSPRLGLVRVRVDRMHPYTQALYAAASNLFDSLGTLEDLGPELANTVANVYYRYALASGNVHNLAL